MKNLKKEVEVVDVVNVVNYEMVDLGLSVKWANMNVGADKVEDFGKYFAWNNVKLDEKGRMPSESEFEELLDKCIWEWENRNGMNGYKVKSRVNEESIFLPAAGLIAGDELMFDNQVGYYLSSSVNERPIGACELVISKNYHKKYVAGLYKRSIRLVSDK